MTERYGDWMNTITGRTFWPIDPRPEDVCIEDIAHALSMMCRFNGHIPNFYSVAEHSVLVSRHCDQKDALYGLLHDAPEAYIADIVRPAKRFIKGYAHVENNIMTAIALHFGLPLQPPSSVKTADNAILLDEAAELVGERSKLFNIPGQRAFSKIECHPPAKARQLFLDRFDELTRGAH
jgi:uncharacterized protein